MKVLALSKILPLVEFSLYGQSLLWSFLVTTAGPLGSNVAIQARAVGYLKQGNLKRLSYLCGHSLSATIMCCCFLILSIWVACLFDYLSFDRSVSAVLGVFLGFTQAVFLLKTTVIRSNFDFNRYARLCALRGLLTFICYISVLGSISFFAFYIFLDIAVTWAIIGPAKLPFPLRWSKKVLWHFNLVSHVKKNSSLIFFVLTSFLLISFERITGYLFLNDYEYAVLAFAGIFFSVSATIQSIVNSYIFPMMAKNYGENGRNKLIIQGALYTTFTALSLGFVALLLVFIFADLVITFFNKIPLNMALLWYIALLSILRISDFLTNVFLLLNKERTLVCIRLPACILGLVYVSSHRAGIDLIFAASVCTLIIYTLGFTVLFMEFKPIAKKTI
jgi:hypothetical protein